MPRTVTNRTIGTNEEFTTTVFARYSLDTFQDGERVFTQHNNQSRYARVGIVDVLGKCEVRFIDYSNDHDYINEDGPYLPERDALLLAKAWVLRKV